MDYLLYKQNIKLEKSSKAPRYPITMKFTKDNWPNYQDNSLTKHNNSKKSFKSKEQLLSQSKKELKTVITRHKHLNERVESYTSEFFDYLHDLHNFELAESLMQQAAIKIQKCVKGFLIRRKFD